MTRQAASYCREIGQDYVITLSAKMSKVVPSESVESTAFYWVEIDLP